MTTPTDIPSPRSPAGCRAPRPATIDPCPTCGSYLGRGYPACPTCHDALEGIWRADWLAFLASKGFTPGTPDETLLAGIVVAEFLRYPWTIVDYALTLLRCDECCAGPCGVRHLRPHPRQPLGT